MPVKSYRQESGEIKPTYGTGESVYVIVFRWIYWQRGGAQVKDKRQEVKGKAYMAWTAGLTPFSLITFYLLLLTFYFLLFTFYFLPFTSLSPAPAAGKSANVSLTRRDVNR